LLVEAQKLRPTPPETTDPQGLRQAILTALGQLGLEQAEYIALLVDVIKKDREGTVRQTAAAALGRIGPPAKTAVPALLDSYKASVKLDLATDQGGARRAVIEAMARIDPDPKTYLPLLQDALKKDRDPGVLVAAVTAAGRLGTSAKPAVPLLREVQQLSLAVQPAGDASGVRKAVLDALGKIDPDPKVLVPVLIDVLLKDRDPELRLTAMATLARIGPPAKAALPVLTEIQKAGKLATAEQDKTAAAAAESAIKAIKGN
jgi:HEAT repeat protein